MFLKVHTRRRTVTLCVADTDVNFICYVLSSGHLMTIADFEEPVNIWSARHLSHYS